MELSNLLGWFAPTLLVSCVWVVAALLALSRWGRHPNVSLLVLLGSLLLLVSGLGGSVVQYALMRAQVSGNWSIAQYSLMLAVLGGTRALLSITAYILLICAIFGWRRESAPFPRLHDEGPRAAPRDINQNGEINRPGSEDLQKPV